MTRRLTIQLTVATAVFLAASIVQAGGDPTIGQSKAAACAGCHGADGNSANAAFPSLAGQHAGYIAKQLADYKSGQRVNALMAGMVAALTPEDMEHLGAFYAAQAKTAQPAEGRDAALIAQGRKLYEAGNPQAGVAACAACHGHQGYGNPGAGYPVLRAQHAGYVELTLKAFRDGARANDANAIMRHAVARLTDDDIRALAAYTASIR
ncbi:MAG: c-type cytochrome [Pseudomonadota bacterium]